jgi:hypothetical protein
MLGAGGTSVGQGGGTYLYKDGKGLCPCKIDLLLGAAVTLGSHGEALQWLPLDPKLIPLPISEIPSVHYFSTLALLTFGVIPYYGVVLSSLPSLYSLHASSSPSPTVTTKNVPVIT